MIKIGVIDLGSNTSRLVIYACEPGVSYKLVDQVRERVRLAEGIGPDGALHEEPMRRALESLTLFRSLCKASQVDKIIALATSATRDASNQAEFLRRAKEACGVELRVLSGEEEAYYGYLGMINAFQHRDCFMFDLGGGSVQVMQVINRQVRHGFSLPLGAVRMSERFFRSTPPPRKHVDALYEHVCEKLGQHFSRLKSPTPLIGSGGTARALAKIDQEMRGYRMDRLHGYELKIDALDDMIKRMSRMTLGELEKMPGMNEERTDVILGGALVIRALAQVGRFDSILISSTGVREGAFFEQFLRHGVAPNDATRLAPPIVANPRQFAIDNMAHQYQAWNEHSFHVRNLACQLFDGLKPLHGYGEVERELLCAGALLHDIGYSIAYYNHDKHSQYLIESGDLPAFTHREIALIGLMTRYHRKGEPDCSPYADIFEKGDVDRARVLAGIVRLAEYLERGRRQIVRGLTCHFSLLYKDDVIVRTDISQSLRTEASMELWEAQRHSSLLAQALDRNVRVI